MGHAQFKSSIEDLEIFSLIRYIAIHTGETHDTEANRWQHWTIYAKLASVVVAERHVGNMLAVDKTP